MQKKEMKGWAGSKLEIDPVSIPRQETKTSVRMKKTDQIALSVMTILKRIAKENVLNKMNEKIFLRQFKSHQKSQQHSKKVLLLDY